MPLQSALCSNQDLQKGMEAHKSEVLSINLSSADFLQSEPDSEEAWELRDRLKEINSRWDRLSGSLEDWREELQRALMQCQVMSRTSFLNSKTRATSIYMCRAYLYANRILSENSQQRNVSSSTSPVKHLYLKKGRTYLGRHLYSLVLAAFTLILFKTPSLGVPRDEPRSAAVVGEHRPQEK